MEVKRMFFIIVVIVSFPQFCLGEKKRLLVDDNDAVQTHLHQIDAKIQSLTAQIAEKDIHLVQLQQVVHGLNDQVTKLESSNKQKDAEIAGLKSSISTLQHTVLQQDNLPIAFYAFRTSNLAISSVKAHQTIIYDRVDLNVGNGYNASNGVFTAPSTGIYVFTIATGSHDNAHSTIELVQNGIIKDITWADSMDHGDRAAATTTTPLKLTKGDIIAARIGSHFGGSYLESNIYIRCSFSGAKIDG